MPASLQTKWGNDRLENNTFIPFYHRLVFTGHKCLCYWSNSYMGLRSPLWAELLQAVILCMALPGSALLGVWQRGPVPSPAQRHCLAEVLHQEAAARGHPWMRTSHIAIPRTAQCTAGSTGICHIPAPAFICRSLPRTPRTQSEQRPANLLCPVWGAGERLWCCRHACRSPCMRRQCRWHIWFPQ